MVAALSDRSVIFYDASAGQVTHRIEKAHDGPISQIAFFPLEYRGLGNSTSMQLVLTASLDGTIKVWNATQQQPLLTMKLELANEQALGVSLGYDGTLLAVGTSKARISFFDLRYADDGNSMPSGALMGSYVDAHTEDVTFVQFQTIPSQSSPQTVKTILASASEDGLVSIHDPSQPTEDDALLSVININSPLREVGFFGPALEGMYALTGSETMSVHHWDSAQKVSDVGGVGLRRLLSDAVSGRDGNNNIDDNMMMAEEGNAVEYLIGCTWVPMLTTAPLAQSPALHLVAGNSNGDCYIFRIDADQITPICHLKGGHRGCIRGFAWVEYGMRLMTGGEDARLCEWDLSGNAPAVTSSSAHRKDNEGGRPIGGKMKKSSSNGGRVSKGKKKIGSPY